MERREDRIGDTGLGQVQLVGSHLGGVEIVDDRPPQRTCHRLEPPATGERRLATIDQFAEHIKRAIQPLTLTGCRIVSAAAQQHDVAGVELRVGRSSGEKIEDLAAFDVDLQRPRERQPFVLPHRVFGVADLQQQDAERFGYA